MKKYIINSLITGLVMFAIILIPISCKKNLEVSPPINELGTALVFTSNTTAVQSITGMYIQMMQFNEQFSSRNTTLFAGMYADELTYYLPTQRDEFANNSITEINHGVLTASFWGACYKYIYSANLAIEGLTKSNKITSDLKNKLVGEAKFVRAFCFFYLVNLFGDVPLTLNPDYRINTRFARTPAKEVYNQIISDLKDAEIALPVLYETTTSNPTDRTRPNKWAAAALLARIYLYNGDWGNAELESSKVITAGIYSLPADINTVFLKASPEAIWQLQPVNSVYNTWESEAIIPASAAADPKYILRPGIVNVFESGDSRRSKWVGTKTVGSQTYYYPFKYKVYQGTPPSEYYMVLRLAEQFLIRAEARARQNKLNEAKADLNMIRNRSLLPNSAATTQAEILTDIEKERRVELFAEWGHRWFDLKRTGRADAVIGALKPTTWNKNDTLWPIPIDQLRVNPKLVQNAGY